MPWESYEKKLLVHLSPEDRRLIEDLSKRLGISRSGLIRMLIRQKAKEEGIL